MPREAREHEKHERLLREALGHDEAVLRNVSLVGPAAARKATEAQCSGLAGETWHCLGAIPQDGGSPAMELLALLKRLLLAMGEAKTCVH